MAQINKPNEYFNTVLYTGNGGTQSVTGVGFQPDLVWNKSRSSAFAHGLNDVVRGAGNTLISNNTDAEQAWSAYFTSFDSDGFSMASGGGTFNASSVTYASWNWLAGGTASSNTDGSITSNVSANTTSGFSVVSYTGTGANATVGHGLGVTPKMIIIKGRSSSFDWTVGNSNLGWDKYLMLHSTNAEATDTTVFNNTAPTSSVFSLGTNVQQNASGGTYIAYCFAEKKGFSKFSTFTGNGNADGTFVYTGFKPAFVMWKNTTNAGYYWHTMDNKREPNNPAGLNLFPNLSDAENDYGDTCDFVSNGFKFRTGSSGINATNQVYIYMAFAENPLVGTNNIPATAR